jgi:thiosulfate/3-mercaptopyruvate sulfurtransferase
MIGFVATLAMARLPLLDSLAAAENEAGLVSIEWLQTHLAAPDLVILDTRSPALYAQGHISGAMNVPVLDTFGSESRPDLVVPISRIQTLFSHAGVDQESRVVVYDGGEMINAARVLWVLEMHGHRRVSMLDAGYPHWVERGLPHDMQPGRQPARHFLSHISPQRLATKFSIRLALSDPDTVIVDARTGPEYSGKVSQAARYGHIPGAISVPAGLALAQPGGGLREFAELEQIYSVIDRDKKVITYCNKGREAALTYFILRQLGYDVAAYEGSWIEWGNDMRLPVETGGDAVSR